MVRVLMRDANTAQDSRPPEKEHYVPFRLVVRCLAIPLVDQTLHRLGVDLRPRIMDLEQKLDRAWDRTLATKPTAQRDRLHLQEPREVPIRHNLSAAATATVVNDELESCGRHGGFLQLRRRNVVTVQ